MPIASHLVPSLTSIYDVPSAAGVQVQTLKEPDPWCVPWAVVGLQATCEHLLVLEASGMVLELDWEGGHPFHLLAPPMPWTAPQGGLILKPQTWYGEGRILPLEGGGVLRFLSTEVRHVRMPSRAELKRFDRRGRCLGVARVVGIQPRLLASTLDGARALVAVPGHLVRDPWRCRWIRLHPADPCDASGAEAPLIRLETSAGLEAGRTDAESWGDFSGAVQALDAPCWLLWRDGRLSHAVSPDVPPEPLTPPELEGVRYLECLSIAPRGCYAVLRDDRQRVTLLALEPRRVVWQRQVSHGVGAWCSGRGDVRVLTAFGEVLDISAEGSPKSLGRLEHPSGVASGTFVWGVGSSCGERWGSAVGRGLVVHSLRTGVQRSGQLQPLLGERVGLRDADARREHLPEPRVSRSGRWRLSIVRDWEMTDPYQSADCWFLLAEAQGPEASEEARALERFQIRLPEQPFEWGEELSSDCVLLRDMRGAWMVVHLSRRTALPLASPGESAQVALCGGGVYMRRSRLEGRSEQGGSPVPMVESIDLATGCRLNSAACGAAERPLAGSSDGALVLLQDGSRLRVLRLEGGVTLAALVLTVDEADEAEWQEPGGFWVRTRRGAELLVRVL